MRQKYLILNAMEVISLRNAEIHTFQLFNFFANVAGDGHFLVLLKVIHHDYIFRFCGYFVACVYYLVLNAEACRFYFHHASLDDDVSGVVQRFKKLAGSCS